jgi:hypothetical protein
MSATYKMSRNAAGQATITSANGRTYLLKGYGALKGQFEVRKGLDLTKPIAEQVKKAAMRKRKTASLSKTTAARKKGRAVASR